MFHWRFSYFLPLKLLLFFMRLFPRAEVIGAVVELQIGATFRIFPAFAFFLRWLASPSRNYSSSC